MYNACIDNNGNDPTANRYVLSAQAAVTAYECMCVLSLAMAQFGIGERILSVNHVVYLFNQAGCFSPKRASFSCKYKTNPDLIPEPHLNPFEQLTVQQLLAVSKNHL